jgi:hypothetical protein
MWKYSTVSAQYNIITRRIENSAPGHPFVPANTGVRTQHSAPLSMKFGFFDKRPFVLFWRNERPLAGLVTELHS